MMMTLTYLAKTCKYGNNWQAHGKSLQNTDLQALVRGHQENGQMKENGTASTEQWEDALRLWAMKR
jgi:hypothetical protein